MSLINGAGVVGGKSLSFACPKESNQRKRPPIAPPLRGSQNFAQARGRSQTRGSWSYLRKKLSTVLATQTVRADGPRRLHKILAGQHGYSKNSQLHGHLSFRPINHYCHP